VDLAFVDLAFVVLAFTTFFSAMNIEKNTVCLVFKDYVELFFT